MKFLSNTFSALFALALLAGLGAGVFMALQFIVGLYAGLDKQLVTVLVTTSVTVILSAAIIAGGIRGAMKREKDQRLLAEKATTYGCLIEVWAETLQQPGSQRVVDGAKVRELSHELNTQLILWGSNRVLKQFIAFQKLEREVGLRDPKVLSQVEKVLLEIRQDLGQINWGLKESEALNLLLSDADNELVEHRDPVLRADPMARV